MCKLFIEQKSEVNKRHYENIYMLFYVCKRHNKPFVFDAVGWHSSAPSLSWSIIVYLFVCLWLLFAFILFCFNFFLLSFKFWTMYSIWFEWNSLTQCVYSPSVCLSHSHSLSWCICICVSGRMNYFVCLFVYKLYLFYATNQYWMRQNPNKEGVKY